MSWREQYQQGSFRGVPFRTAIAEKRGGRQGETHSFPGREQPWREDITRTPHGYSFECFVAGDDYYAARDALEEALDAAGPGTLVHPFRGLMTISVSDWTVRESAGEDGGGVADYTIEFVESGSLVVTPAAADTGEQVRAAAFVAQAEAPGVFAGEFNVEGLPGFISDAAQDIVRYASATSLIVAGVLGGPGAALHAISAGAHLLGGSAAALVRSPLALAQSVIGIVQTVRVLGSTASRIGALFGLASFGADLAAIAPTTPARQRQRDNQDALIQLVSVAASAELVRAIADYEFPSYQDAVEMRTRADDLLDTLMLRAADRGDDVAVDTFNAIRDAMVRDVTARGGSLARLQNVSVLKTEPALVIAHRLYGGDAEARSQQIVSRNRIAHPGFVPGGIAIEVLTPGPLDG